MCRWKMISQNCVSKAQMSHATSSYLGVYLVASYLSTFITMSVCQCSQCFPSRNRAIKTIKKHLHEDKILLKSSEQRHTQEFAGHLQNCIDLNTRYLESLESSDEGKAIHTYYMVESESQLSRFRQLIWCRWVMNLNLNIQNVLMAVCTQIPISKVQVWRLCYYTSL